MSEAAIHHMEADLEVLKKDVAVIKHILSEEGRLSPEARQSLNEARKTPPSDCVSHEALKKRVLK